MQEVMQAEKNLSPYFFVKSDDPDTDQLPLKSTDVDVDIAGVIADVKVTQVYTNAGTRPIEAIYVFPASTKAAVYGMKMTIGERTIVAEIKERQQARQEYEEARRVGKSASLLEQQRPNVFQMNVANILPGDEIKVELSYTELLVPTDGLYEFMYPTVVGPRYSTPGNANEMPVLPGSDQWVSNPYLHEGETPTSTFGLMLNLVSGLPVQEMLCASHKINADYKGPSLADVKLDESEKYGGNRDFILKYRLSGGQIESGLLLYEGEEENFFLLMVQPPKRIVVGQIPAREYIFILDVSGSMHGFPLNTAKKLLNNLMGNIRSTDMFNILLFSFGSGLLAKQSLPANPENIRKGLELIKGQSGGGGTELLPALKRALSLPKTEEISRTIIIVTDGYVDVEVEAFDLIRNNLGNANMFAFGIGSSVNHYLIEGMARVGMGEPFIVTHPNEAPSEAEKLRQYIQSPVLTRLNVAFNGFDVYDVEPVSIPDVLAERPVIVFGKWKGQPAGEVTIRGLTGEQPYEKTFDVSEVQPLEINTALRYLWARHRITLLSDYNNLRTNDERTREITNLGLTYNLLTAYTSFVAIDSEIRRKGEDVETVEQPLPLPEGVSEYAVGDVARISRMGFVAMSPGMASAKMMRTMASAPTGLVLQELSEDFLESEEMEASFAVLEEIEEVKVTVSDITVDGGLQPEIVENTLKTILQDLESYYQKMLRKRPHIEGKVLVTFVIALSNRAKNVEIVSNELKEKKIERYMRKRIEKLRFPAREDRSDVTVSCIFKFEVV